MLYRLKISEKRKDNTFKCKKKNLMEKKQKNEKNLSKEKL